jgi:hypothetical protein
MKTSVGRVVVEERDIKSMLDEMEAPLDQAAMDAGFQRLRAAMARDERLLGRLTRWLARRLGLLTVTVTCVILGALGGSSVCV